MTIVPKQFFKNYLNTFLKDFLSDINSKLKQSIHTYLFPWFILLFLIFIFGGFKSFHHKAYKIKTVIIDAGHGGKDPGTHGKFVKEKDIALKVALNVGKLIRENIPGVKIIFTRKTDVFIELDERANIGNRNHADLFISIHCNANPFSSAIYGTETYTMGLHTSEENLEVAKRENSVILQEKDYKGKYDGFDPESPEAYILLSNFQSAFIDNSLKFSELVEKQFKYKAGRKSRGVKQAGFLVLRRTAMPSSLIEIGYLTNAKEEIFLKSKDGQDRIASAIYKGFKEYKQTIESVGEN